MERLKAHAGITHIDEGALKYLKEKYAIGSMLDIGCGVGGMEELAKKDGIAWIGVEGDPDIDKGTVIRHDYNTGPLKSEFTSPFDLGWCVEFLEHIEEKYLPNVISTLQMCKVLVITHAPPQEENEFHVTCRNGQYWVSFLDEIGFTFDYEASIELRKASTMEREFMRKTGMVFINRKYDGSEKSKVVVIPPKRVQLPVREAKEVTMLGFGDSGRGNSKEAIGVIWSLNNCYELLAPQCLPMLHTIFEMHDPIPRARIRAKDGRTHFSHLAELGASGVRIVMQQQHPDIPNSVAFPRYQIEQMFGDVCPRAGTFFGGTPPYMPALAILEGYDEIRTYGFDQAEWSHLKQRESWIWWLGVSVGRGIKLSGKQMFWRDRMYGYDFGPDFDAQNIEELCEGFPEPMASRMKFEIRLLLAQMAHDGKGVRAAQGLLCDKVGG